MEIENKINSSRTLKTRLLKKRGLVVMAKAPVAGEVKTRMQPTLTPGQSASLHCDLLSKCLTTVSDADVDCRELWISAEHPHWQKMAQNHALTFYQQSEGDLGEKLIHAAGDALLRSEQIIVIGSDCPFIDSLYIESAYKALQNYDVVIGPATDGGYVLIGFKQLPVSVFQDIDWGGDQVFKQTLEKIQFENLSCCHLWPLADIDRPEDLELLKTAFPDLDVL